MSTVVKHDLIKDVELLSSLMKRELPPKEDLMSGTVIDRVLPIYRTSMTLVCAKPKSGKSMFIAHLAINMAKMGHSVLYISLENGSRVDRDRFQKAIDLYHVSEKEMDNFAYLPFDDGITNEHLGFAALIDFISKPECTFDVIFIDALERVITRGESGAEISANGYKVMNTLQTTIRNSPSKPALVATWQFNKSSFDKKIEDIDMDALAGSVAAVQIAETLWVIRRDSKKRDNWKARLIGSRELSADETIVDVYYNNNFDISYEKDLDGLLKSSL